MPEKTMGIEPRGKQVLACPRIPVARLMKFPNRPDGTPFLPVKYREALEHNQKIASCCRHPENHDIVALKSDSEQTAPDIYKFICDGCGRVHTRFCVGGGDPRPVWQVR